MGIKGAMGGGGEGGEGRSEGDGSIGGRRGVGKVKEERRIYREQV